jgi:hypothetical protein
VKFWRRFVGATVLLLSTIGFVGCLATLVGIWMFYQTVYEKVEKIASRLEAGLQRTAVANQNVQRALEQARSQVEELRKESADLDGGRKKNLRADRICRALIQQQSGQDGDDLGGRLATFSDSAIAVSSLLESFQEVPLAHTFRIDSDHLKRRAEEARQASSILRRLEVALADGNTDSRRQEVNESTGEVNVFLRKCQAIVDGWQSDLDETRDDLAHVRAKLLGWLTCTAVVVTVLCSWMGAGQISLFALALRWCKAR